MYRFRLSGQCYKRIFSEEKKDTLEILFSQEKEPLETEGATKNAESFIKNSSFLVMNGDAFCESDLRKFIRFHKKKKSLILKRKLLEFAYFVCYFR